MENHSRRGWRGIYQMLLEPPACAETRNVFPGEERHFECYWHGLVDESKNEVVTSKASFACKNRRVFAGFGKMKISPRLLGVGRWFFLWIQVSFCSLHFWGFLDKISMRKYMKKYICPTKVTFFEEKIEKIEKNIFWFIKSEILTASISHSNSFISGLYLTFGHLKIAKVVRFLKKWFDFEGNHEKIYFDNRSWTFYQETIRSRSEARAGDAWSVRRAVANLYTVRFIFIIGLNETGQVLSASRASKIGPVGTRPNGSRHLLAQSY